MTGDTVQIAWRPAPAHTLLLAELRSLHARLPVPQPSWHPHVGLIDACRSDLGRAVDALAASPAALDLLAALVDGEPEPEFDSEASEQLTEAWRRVQALPLPEGRHPFLDEIVPAVDALRLALVALSRAPGGVPRA